MDSIDVSDWQWLDLHRRIPQADLARLCNMSSGDVDALVERGVLVPLSPRDSALRHFSGGWVAPLREVARLRAQHRLDLSTASLLLGYLQRISQLEQQVRALQAHPAHPVQLPREGPTPWREPHA